MATRAPSATSAVAVARPIPRAAPVMNTTLPDRERDFLAIAWFSSASNVRMRTRYSFRSDARVGSRHVGTGERQWCVTFVPTLKNSL